MGKPPKKTRPKPDTPAAGANGGFNVLSAALNRLRHVPPGQRAMVIVVIVVVALVMVVALVGRSTTNCSQVSGGNIGGGSVSCGK